MKTELKMPVVGTTKEPQTRVLDFLAGWAEFVYGQEDEHPDSLAGDEIYDLYNEFAGTLDDYDGKTHAEKEQLVRTFVERRVLPAILRSK